MTEDLPNFVSIPQRSKPSNDFQPIYRPSIARLPGNQSPVFRSVVPDAGTPGVEWYCKE